MPNLARGMDTSCNFPDTLVSDARTHHAKDHAIESAQKHNSFLLSLHVLPLRDECRLGEGRKEEGGVATCTPGSCKHLLQVDSGR